MHGDRPEPDRVLSHGMIDGVTHDKKLNCSQCQNKAQEESVRQCAGCCCAVARSGGQSRRGGPLRRDEPPAEAKYTGTVLCLGSVGKNSPAHDSGTREIREQIAGEWLLMSSS